MANKHSKKWILLTPQQWCGVGVLIVLGLGTLFGLHYLQGTSEPESTVLADSALHLLQQHQQYQDSVRKLRYPNYHREEVTVSRHPFDPNTADSISLLQQGFRPWQVRNMLKYRAKGGCYRKPQDLKRLYGMTDSLYGLLEPYICIADSFQTRKFILQKPNENFLLADSTLQADTLQADTMVADTMVRWRTVKKDTMLNLREADTTQLKWIRGIGSYRAKEIVRYRERLGGYTDVRQLTEIPALQSLCLDSLMHYFYLDTVVVTQFSINHCTVAQLQRHPYISFTQAQALYTLRRKRVRLHSMDDLGVLREFSSNDLARLKPYLSFAP